MQPASRLNSQDTPAPADHRESAVSAEKPLGASKATSGVCKKCGTQVGQFFNLFHKISGTYYLPVLLGSWSSRLKAKAKQQPHPASPGTELEGCLIQPRTCPACPALLGFLVLEAPAHKEAFRGREFFKLSRIELLFEDPTTGETQEVPPYVDPSESLDSTQSTPGSKPATEVPSQMSVQPHDRMEARTQPSHPDLHIKAHRQSIHSLPSPTSAGPAPSPNGIQKANSGSTTLPPSPASRHDHFAHPPTRENSTGLANRTRELPPITNPPPQPPAQSAYPYPRSPHEVPLDAVDRLQTQISQHSGALSMQNHEVGALKLQTDHNSSDLRHLEEAFRVLRQEVQDCNNNVHALHQRIAALESRPPPPATPAASAIGQSPALELMNERLHGVSQKVVDVETLKTDILILRDQVRRLEEEKFRRHDNPPAGTPVHAVPHQMPTQPPPVLTDLAHTHRPSYFPSPGSHGPPEPARSERAESVQVPSTTWTAVNAGVKRGYTNGVESPHSLHCRRSISPKRPKLAPTGQPVAYDKSEEQPLYEVIPSGTARVPTYTHAPVPSTAPAYAAPPQLQPRESLPESTPTPSSHQPTYPQQAYTPYSTQDVTPTDAWRSQQPQRTPRGRPRTGPGSRGGRTYRRSLATQEFHLVDTPGSEHRFEAAGPMGTPVPYEMPGSRGRDIVRRGSGGGVSSRGGREASTPRPVLGMQGVTPGAGVVTPGSTPDPYAHTKKTRTKPIRNADGVLIRKDGQPDKRSQSSAANLKRVHARKEEQRSGGSVSGQHTPTSASHLRFPMTMSPSSTRTPSPEDVTNDLPSSVKRRHHKVIGKMFPGGLEESRKDIDYGRVFEDDGDHVAVPRNGQGHHHHTHKHHGGQNGVQRDRHDVSEARHDGVVKQEPDIDSDRAPEREQERERHHSHDGQNNNGSAWTAINPPADREDSRMRDAQPEESTPATLSRNHSNNDVEATSQQPKTDDLQSQQRSERTQSPASASADVDMRDRDANENAVAA